MNDRKEYFKKYYQAHREEYSKKAKEYYRKHREAMLEQHRAYRQTNRDRINRRALEDYHKNKKALKKPVELKKLPWWIREYFLE